MTTCQCTSPGERHGATCDGAPYKVVLRDGERLEVCHDCFLSGDEHVAYCDPADDPEWDAYVEAQSNVCECEMDYNCHLHSGRNGTWIETRYHAEIMDEPWWAQ